MHIEYFLFPVFLLIAFWLIPKIAFIKNADLTTREVKLLLAIKMLSGIAGAFYFSHIALQGDYLPFNTEGKAQYELLISNPKLFFTDFSHDIKSYGFGGLLECSNSFWGYLRFNLLFKCIALFNLISGGNFYFNSVIFCSLVFFGHIAFYRTFSEMYPGQRLKIVFASFFLPSLFLYTCCVHKDGIVFLGSGMVSFIFYVILTRPQSIRSKHMWSFCAAIGTIFIFRNYVLIALLPAMAIALLCKWLPYPRKLIFITSYFCCFVLFFLTGTRHSALNLPAAVVKRKDAFISLGEGTTNIPMNELYPTLKSFLINLPQVINHFCLRPYLWEFASPGVFLTALELLFYQLLLISFVFFRKKGVSMVNNFNVFGLAFFINMVLIIGYTIPNVGAIVRYRSTIWVFLICPLLCVTDWYKVIALLPFKRASQRHNSAQT